MSSIFAPLIGIFQAALDFYFAITQDWGAAIILLTLSIRLLLFIVNMKSAKQQVIQTQIHVNMQQLKEKYSHDARKQSEEMIKLYGKHPLL